MDARRGRSVIDPKVRQVGFVTPGSEAPEPAGIPGAGTAGGAVVVAANSPSPVIIAPPRPLDIPQKAAPMNVPSPTRNRVGDAGEPSMPLGSYNPSDTVLGSSSLPSSKIGSINGGFGSVATETVSELSPVRRPTASTIERFSDRVNNRTTNSVATSMPTVVGSIGGRLNKGVPPQQGLPVMAGSVPQNVATESSTVASEVSKPLKERTSKAERRAMQEAQRAAKAAAKETIGSKTASGDGGEVQREPKAPKLKKDTVTERKAPQTSEKKGMEKGTEKEKKKEVPAPRLQFDDEQRVAKAKRRSLVDQTETKNRVELFRHLPQFVHGTQLPSLEAKFFQDDILHPHPAVYKVGLQYLTGDIVGGNARCVAMLMALRDMILDYSTPAEKTLVRDLMAKINSHVSFLITCRPLSISMGNAIKFLKTRIAKLTVTLPEAEAKASLVADIDTFIQEKIVFADKEIVRHAVEKIRDGDVLLTHGYSCVVEMILLRAHEMGKKFRVVVVDSRPKLEGRGLLRRLLQGGLQCTYTHMNASSYIMQEVTRVFLGASSVLSNGTVYSRVGTACVAMVAHALSVPVMICCETYKFHERVQLDSICSNELGDPDALVKVPGRSDLSTLDGWANNEHLQLLNLTYDATPADYVSMIITELGMVPPTSVPVILREYRKEPTI